MSSGILAKMALGAAEGAGVGMVANAKALRAEAAAELAREHDFALTDVAHTNALDRDSINNDFTREQTEAGNEFTLERDKTGYDQDLALAKTDREFTAGQNRLTRESNLKLAEMAQEFDIEMADKSQGDLLEEIAARAEATGDLAIAADARALSNELELSANNLTNAIELDDEMTQNDTEADFEATNQNIREVEQTAELPGSSNVPAAIQENEYVAGLLASKYGRDDATDADRLAARELVNRSKTNPEARAKVITNLAEMIIESEKDKNNYDLTMDEALAQAQVAYDSIASSATGNGMLQGGDAGEGDPYADLPHPTSREETEALPSGTQFVSPDGTLKIKP